MILITLGTYTLPVYSIAIQMGSDFKHHMLPPSVKEKLTAFAQRARRNVSQREEAAKPDMTKVVEGGAAVAMAALKSALVPHSHGNGH